MKDKIEKWFCNKYGIDILKERMNIKELCGNDVVRFIDNFMLDFNLTVIPTQKEIEDRLITGHIGKKSIKEIAENLHKWMRESK